MARPTPGGEGPAEPGPVIRDRRRLDPQTGQVREAYAASRTEPGGNGSAPGAQADAAGTSSAPQPAGTDASGQPAGDGPGEAASGQADEPASDLAAELATARAQAEEHLGDLQRLQAEYVNYRRRVERDRALARDVAVAEVLEALLPVLDDVHLARQHGDLEGGPFAAIADKLEAVLGRYGLQRYGEPGEPFDPSVHEALMHTEAELAEGTTTTTVVQVLQPGYRAGDRVLRAARVAVADPATP